MAIVTQLAFARSCGVTKAAVSKWAQGAGKAALVGSRVDVDHPESKKYAKRHARGDQSGKKQGSATAPAPTSTPRKRAKAAGAPPRPQDVPLNVSLETIESYAHLSLDELIRIFSGAVAFKDWLDSRKKISDIREKDLKNAETEGRLISRELVRIHVFGAIEASNHRLLGDSPKTIARRLYGMARSGASIEEAEAVVREIVSAQLRAVKSAAAHTLRQSTQQARDGVA